MKTIKQLTIFLILIIPAKKIVSCTIFYIEKDGIVLAGNNEDWKDPSSMIFFYPPKQGQLGWVKFGWGSGFPQGGMNEHGLFWDATAGAYVPMPVAVSHKTKLEIPIMKMIIEQCASVEDSRKIFDKYYCEDQYKAQYLVGGANGRSVIVEGDTILNKQSDYQVLTNFYQTKPDLGGYPCWRYNKATELLGSVVDLNPYFIAQVLASTHQEGKYPTQYSNIYDLKNQIIYLFHFHNFNEFITIDLQKELQNGKRSYLIADLFAGINHLSADFINTDTNKSVNFSWYGKQNCDYEIHYSTNPEFLNSQKVYVSELPINSQTPYYYATFSLLALLSFLCFPRKLKGKAILIVFLFAFYGGACEKDEIEVIENTQHFQKIINGFENGKTYYWKVIAQADSNSGFKSETPVQSFNAE